jgi:hypothetical protein
LKSVGVDVTNEYPDKIGKALGPAEIWATCDRFGITHSGYSAIYKQFWGGVKAAGKGLRITCLPKPYHVSLLRKELNSKLKEFVGDYYSIIESKEFFPAKGSSKKKDPVHVKLTKNNSFFVDIEKVQQMMVQLYQITTEGISYTLTSKGLRSPNWASCFLSNF